MSSIRKSFNGREVNPTRFYNTRKAVLKIVLTIAEKIRLVRVKYFAYSLNFKLS